MSLCDQITELAQRDFNHAVAEYRITLWQSASVIAIANGRDCITQDDIVRAIEKLVKPIEPQDT